MANTFKNSGEGNFPTNQKPKESNIMARVPALLYSKEYPTGKKIISEQEYDQALEDGFVEAPDDIGKEKVEVKKAGRPSKKE